jgi:hypothetical protein
MEVQSVGPVISPVKLHHAQSVPYGDVSHTLPKGSDATMLPPIEIMEELAIASDVYNRLSNVAWLSDLTCCICRS